jgi:dihydrolipoamide dehydrogenase
MPAFAGMTKAYKLQHRHIQRGQTLDMTRFAAALLLIPLAGLTGIVNHEVIPSVVYTMPEIAGVGLTEEQAREKGEVKVGKFPMLANSRAKTNRETDGFVKVIADAKTDRVLGVWIIASVGGTMIAQAAQAMEFGATSEDIAYTCHAHPTHSEAIKEAAMAVLGKPIHI